MTNNTIPIAQLAHFGDEGRTCAVWWSEPDQAVIGLYATLPRQLPDRARHAVHQLVSCRPQQCEGGPCRCDRPCTALVMAMIYDAVPAADLVEVSENGHPAHPGDDYLADLRDLWAYERMGWSRRVSA